MCKENSSDCEGWKWDQRLCFSGTMFRDALQDLLPRYPQGRSLSALKFRDVMKVMPFIPQIERGWYVNPRREENKFDEQEEENIDILGWTKSVCSNFYMDYVIRS
jgi:hypothetical protein